MSKKHKNNESSRKKKSISLPRSSQERDNYLFILQALNSCKAYCYYEKIKVDFSPISTYNIEIVRTGGVEESILPTFNLDKKYWTKSFVIGLRKVKG